MGDSRLFYDRRTAGRELADSLNRYNNNDVVVIGLPRGGVVVADEIARALGAPLDVCIVRKVGAPMQPELGLGAIAEGGELVLDHRTIGLTGTSRSQISEIVAEQQRELDHLVCRLRQGRPPIDVRGKTVIVVDDGVASGGSARAALRALRRRGPARLVFAAPVGAAQTLRELAAEADLVVCPYAEEAFHAVGVWYRSFDQVTDGEVLAILERGGGIEPEDEAGTVGTVVIEASGVRLAGDLVVPPDARGIVIFAHGSGSSRSSPRNRSVARVLERAGHATLLFDLLTAEEADFDETSGGELRFDIPLLARRLSGATTWARAQRRLADLPIGYFGASTGAAAALIAAAQNPGTVRAVVSRGGRPDLAGEWLTLVRAPTLFLVGGRDPIVLELNKEALGILGAPKRLDVIPGAAHLFDEPGTLTTVSERAADWFDRYLTAPLVAVAQPSAE